MSISSAEEMEEIETIEATSSSEEIEEVENIEVISNSEEKEEIENIEVISNSEEKEETENIQVNVQKIQQNKVKPAGSVPVTVRYEGNNRIGKPWNTGLFDCHENETNALMTSILPCVTFGQIAEVVDGGDLSCHVGSLMYLWMMAAFCSHWVIGSNYRTKLRKKFNLVEAPYKDAISHIFCPWCSLCQEFRELQSRELDPALGWNGIVAKQNAQKNAQKNAKKNAKKQDAKTLNKPPSGQAMSK